MKNKNQSLINTISRNKTANFAFGISKLLIFFLLFSASGMRAQAGGGPQGIAPYPALELGQVMLIDENDPDWAPAMEQAAVVRTEIQNALNQNPNVEPQQYVICSGDICCWSETRTVNGVTIRWTVCVNTNSGKILSSKVTQ